MKHEAPKPERHQLRTLRRALLVGALSTLAACGSSGHSKSASNFAWGKRVSLSVESCGDWTPNHPGSIVQKHLKGKHKYLLTVVDARYNSPKDCDPETDIGAGVYSKTQQDPHFLVTRVPDGTVLKVVGWTAHGQQPIGDLHSDKTYPVWEQIAGHDGTTAWIPWVNAEYTEQSELQQLSR